MDIFIEEDKTIADALQMLNENGKRVLFLHDHGTLLAAVTEDDIRKWILKKGDLQAPVKCAADYRLNFLYEDQADRAAYVMEGCRVEAVPIVDKKHTIKEVIFRETPLKETVVFNLDVPVVIMAGGRGTRLMPYTDILPKPLLSIGDVSMVEHVINCFYTYGCRQFYMLVNYKKDMIKAYFDRRKYDYSLEFIPEEQALGTGGGLSLLKEKVSETFVLTNCDTLIEDDLNKAYKQHISSGDLITMICSVKSSKIPYGVIDIGEEGRIQSLREKPNMAFLVNTGCYFVEPQIIRELKYNHPIDFTDVIEKYVKQGERVGMYPVYERDWFDMGQADGFARVKRRVEKTGREGI